MERENEPMTGAGGESEVHSEMNLHPSKGEGMSGRLDAQPAGTADRVREGLNDAAGKAQSRVDEVRGRVEHARDDLSARASQAQEKAREITSRATSMAERARETIGNASADARRMGNEVKSRANRVADDSGARSFVDRHPLSALGVSFGVGFLLAGSGGEKHGIRGRAKSQLRSALVGAASAAMAQQARAMLGMESGQGGGLGNLMSSMSGGGGPKTSERSTPGASSGV
jgi:ElaB/YqjD/DUF883 family membrane-anchored ribosome-binding protein